MSTPVSSIAVLFADIAGSTRLYEQLGDAPALAEISRCLALAESVAAGHGGRLVKTIGDEAMLAFASADQAAAAAAEIQMRMTSPGECGVPVAFRMGFHFGTAIEAEDGDVFGDGVNVAARMVALAKRGQVILSATTAQVLSAPFKPNLREIDVLTVKGKQQDIGIVELVWDHAELTALVTRPGVREAAHLTLRHGARVIELDETATELTLGRDKSAGIVIADKLASRLHARIERRRDKFVVVDQSSNGTFVMIEGEDEVELRREELILRDRGRIAFGHSSAIEGSELVEFDCG
ncbi:MAG: adenylate/guanylate cyclase domain-containing protein [Burkholderiales bacterium]|nr:adenylate/guanylate cyclase domain-containing protein [Burkholderiales bacterium]